MFIYIDVGLSFCILSVYLQSVYLFTCMSRFEYLNYLYLVWFFFIRISLYHTRVLPDHNKWLVCCIPRVWWWHGHFLSYRWYSGPVLVYYIEKHDQNHLDLCQPWNWWWMICYNYTHLIWYSLFNRFQYWDLKQNDNKIYQVFFFVLILNALDLYFTLCS